MSARFPKARHFLLTGRTSMSGTSWTETCGFCGWTAASSRIRRNGSSFRAIRHRCAAARNRHQTHVSTAPPQPDGDPSYAHRRTDITLDRLEVLSALNFELLRDFGAVLDQIAGGDARGAVLVTG